MREIMNEKEFIPFKNFSEQPRNHSENDINDEFQLHLNQKKELDIVSYKFLKTRRTINWIPKKKIRILMKKKMMNSFKSW
jgi:hypothetical protein